MAAGTTPSQVGVEVSEITVVLRRPPRFAKDVPVRCHKSFGDFVNQQPRSQLKWFCGSSLFHDFAHLAATLAWTTVTACIPTRMHQRMRHKTHPGPAGHARMALGRGAGVQVRPVHAGTEVALKKFRAATSRNSSRSPGEFMFLARVRAVCPARNCVSAFMTRVRLGDVRP